ncbi:hypothetical protein [Spirosoma aerophilum]
MIQILTRLGLWIARVTWAYYLINDLKLLHLPEHLEPMAFALYVGLMLWKISVAHADIEHDDEHNTHLSKLNRIALGILVVACVSEFFRITDLNDSSAIINNLAHCALTILLFVGGELLFDALLLTRAKNKRLSWKAIMRQLKKSFNVKSVTGKSVTGVSKPPKKSKSVNLSQTLAVDESGRLLDSGNSITLTDITTEKSDDDDLNQPTNNLNNTPIL